MKRASFDQIYTFHKNILTKVGLDEETCEAVSFGLCETSLRGVDSHGIRLLPHYVQSALSGRKNPRPNYRFNQVFPAFGHLDADNTYGHAAGMKAIDLAMPLAQDYGLGAIAVSNSSHPGAMASFALRAARQGYIAFAFTHADALVCSHGGERAYFGTNPICMAAPRQESEPFCLDMAPTPIPWNKLLMYRERGEKFPDPYAADENGNPTDDPNSARSLMPIGGYKGYGLAAMVEVLSGVLTGMPFGRAIPPMYTAPMDKPRHLGQFYLVLRADICQSQTEFETRLQQMTHEIRSEPSKPGERVQLANDPQIEIAKHRQKEGIPVDDYLWDEFQQLSGQLGIEIGF
ncbi:MAG: Ldh family oxidoreductase [Cyanobacteria bacterium J06642_11]